MGEFILRFIGILLIFFACSLGREKDSKIEPFSKNWIYQILLVVAGIAILDLTK
jgi:hypothetical protein